MRDLCVCSHHPHLPLKQTLQEAGLTVPDTASVWSGLNLPELDPGKSMLLSPHGGAGETTRWPGYTTLASPDLCQVLYKKTVRALDLLLQNFISENPSMDEVCFLLQVTLV